MEDNTCHHDGKSFVRSLLSSSLGLSLDSTRNGTGLKVAVVTHAGIVALIVAALERGGIEIVSVLVNSSLKGVVAAASGLASDGAANEVEALAVAANGESSRVPVEMCAADNTLEATTDSDVTEALQVWAHSSWEQTSVFASDSATSPALLLHCGP